MDTTDWSAALAGDGEAFGRVFDRHRDRVFRHSVRLVPVAEDAADVVAIVFLEAWRRRETVRLIDGSLLPWLLVTATNTARNLTRTARRYGSLLDRLPPPLYVPDPADGFDNTDATDALRRLPLRDQQVIVLSVLDGLSDGEVAEALGIPVGTVKSRLSRAKRRLGAALPALEHRNTVTEPAHE